LVTEQHHNLPFAESQAFKVDHSIALPYCIHAWHVVRLASQQRAIVLQRQRRIAAGPVYARHNRESVDTKKTQPQFESKTSLVTEQHNNLPFAEPQAFKVDHPIALPYCIYTWHVIGLASQQRPIVLQRQRRVTAGPVDAEALHTWRGAGF
jgi:hypothetical protein